MMTDRAFPDDYTVKTAVAMAIRAPSIHNTQPWNWRLGHSSLHLYADPDRRLPETDPDSRDLILSCGAALHHLRVAFAALGWTTEIHRLPNPDEPDHLAAITLHPHNPSQDEIAMAAAIPRRRTDRRRHSSWTVPHGHIEALTKAAAMEGTILQTADNSARYHLATAIEQAADRHAGDPAYRTELAAWSGRHLSPDGIPARNTPAPDDTPGALRTRPFADPLLAQPPDAKAEDDETILLVLSTASDDRMSRLRAGEATSAVLLTANAFGLSSCPLTEPLELPDVRDTVTERVTGGSFPQMVLRIGWAPANADPLPATPRRDLDDVLQPLDTPPKHFQAH